MVGNYIDLRQDNYTVHSTILSVTMEKMYLYICCRANIQCTYRRQPLCMRLADKTCKPGDEYLYY